MKRRDLFRSAALAPGIAMAQHPSHTAPAKAAAVWKPLLFDAHQSATTLALVDAIIPRTDTPGAADARVHEYLDLQLNDGPPQRRTAFLEGIGWLDGYAIRTFGKPFVKCSYAERIAILKELDRSPKPELWTGAQFFALAKKLTVEGYYTSREGIAELNKGARAPAGFGCKHKGGHKG
jgi:hypothetical protein